MIKKNSNVPQKVINKISLERIENRVLLWIVERLPTWVAPEYLCLVGLLSAIIVGVSYWLTRFSYDWLWLASFGIFINWLADSLDGTLARMRNLVRERYGFYIDHHADTISVCLICLGMGFSPVMDLRVSLLLNIGYFAMMLLTYQVSMTRGVFIMSFARIGPTEVRLILIIANTIVWYLNNPIITIGQWKFTLYSFIGLISAIALMITFLIFSELERRKLAILDPPRSPKSFSKDPDVEESKNYDEK